MLTLLQEQVAAIVASLAEAEGFALAGGAALIARGDVQRPIKIIVDVHERQSGIAETLGELGAEVEIAALPAGDYAVGAETLVERKRVLDLHAAVLKGRLWPQLGKLRAECRFPYLLVEGTDIDRGRFTTTPFAAHALP